VSYSSDYPITFFTAWSAPHPVIEQLAKMYPDITFTHKWADEDIGMNCGEYEYADGERIREFFPEISKERIDFALDMWDLDPAQLGLALNCYGNDYIQLRGESFDLIEVEGQKALSSNQRLTKADIPEVERMPDDDGYEFTVDTDETYEEDDRMTRKKTIVKTGGG